MRRTWSTQTTTKTKGAGSQTIDVEEVQPIRSCTKATIETQTNITLPHTIRDVQWFPVLEEQTTIK